MEGQKQIFQGLFHGGSLRKKPRQEKNDILMDDDEDSSSNSNGAESEAVVESVVSDLSEDAVGSDLFEGKRFFIHNGVSNCNFLKSEIQKRKGTIQKEPTSDDDVYNIVEGDYTPSVRFENCDFVNKDIITKALTDGGIPADIEKYIVHHKKKFNDVLPAEVTFVNSMRGKARTKMLSDRGKSALMSQESRSRLPHTIQLALFHQDARNYNHEVQLQALATSLGYGLTDTSLRNTRNRNPCPFVYSIGTGYNKQRGYKNHLSMVKYLMRSLDFPNFKQNLIHFERELSKHRKFSGKRYNDDVYREVVRVITEELPTGSSPQRATDRICDHIEGMEPSKLQNLFDSKWRGIVKYIAFETGFCADLKPYLLPEGVTDDELFNPGTVFLAREVEEEEEDEDEASLFFRDDTESFYGEREDERIRLSEIQRVSEEPSSYVSVGSETPAKRPVEEVAASPAKRQRQSSVSGSSTSSSEAYYDAVDFSQPSDPNFVGSSDILPEPPSQVPDYTLADDTLIDMTFTNQIADDLPPASQVTQPPPKSQQYAPDPQSQDAQDGQLPDILDYLDNDEEFTMDMFNEYSKRFVELYPNRNPEILAYCGFIFGRVQNYISAMDNHETPTGPEYFNPEELKEMDQLVKEDGDPSFHFFHKDERTISRLKQFFKLYNDRDGTSND